MKANPKQGEPIFPEKETVEYHIPVLLHESIEGLQIAPEGVYMDATFGGGGHAKEILKRLHPKGKLIAFDQDEDAAQNAFQDDQFMLIAANFKYAKKFLRLYGISQIDGILADLGVSSHQFDEAERGFSYRFDAHLDMRMNRKTELTAASILNEYSAEKLQQIFSDYGEVRNAKTLSIAIVEHRRASPFSQIQDLINVLESNRMGEKHRYYAQVFQALRMEVNEELDALKELLLQSVDVLKKGGRIAVITFHSLEDRLVKNFFKNGCFDDEPPKDFFGKSEKIWKVITKKPLTASSEELKRNRRSSSAKLRIAEKI